MRDVAAVLFDDFEMLDLYGPLEMFSYFRDDLRIVPIAARTGPIRSSGGPSTEAEVRFADRQAFDILLVPGGFGVRAAMEDQALLDWLKAAGAQAEIVSSVCTGSLLLARAGLLQGRRATTNKRAFDWVVENGPGVFWQRRARWVEDGNLMTSSGVSAGMDMALALLERLMGPQAAEDAALYAEYIRNPDPDDDPFAGEPT